MNKKVPIVFIITMFILVVSFVLLGAGNYVANVIYGTKGSEIYFDRILSCARCGQHKVPPLTDVNIGITASFSENIGSLILADYFPTDWFVTNSNGGLISTVNSSYSKIIWYLDASSGSASVWYVIKSPQRTTPSTKYYFFSELADIQSDSWQVIVADPPDVTPPQIEFVDPTPPDGRATTNNFTYVNISVSDSNSTSSFIDWNRSLVGYWSMDWYNSTGIYDNSSWNNFGNFSGGLGTSNISVGNYGYGLKFDGWNDFINVKDSDSLHSNNSLTLEAWVNFNELSDYEKILCKPYTTNTSPYIEYVLEIRTSPYTFNFNLAVNGTIRLLAGTTNPTVGVWYHVVGVYDNSTMSIYVNGIKEKSIVMNGTINDFNQNVSIGRYEWSTTPGASEWLNGTVDEIRIWNRALSPEEINASYNSSMYRLYNNFTNLNAGTYQYYAYSIDAAGNTNKTETRTLVIQSIPQYTNNQSQLLTTYSPSGPNFSIIWLDNSGSVNAYLENNFTGNLTNNTMPGNYPNFYYNSSLVIGTYQFRFVANDSDGNSNATSIRYFSISKANPVLIMNNGTYSVNTSSLVGYWTFEHINSSNYIFDYSGNGNDGKFGNGSTWSIPAIVNNGRYGNALHLNGSQFVDISNHSGSKLNMTKITIASWIKTNGSENYSQIIVSKGADRFSLFMKNRTQGGNLIFAMRDSSNGYHSMESNVSANNWDSWQHVVATYNGTHVKFYLNGREAEVDSFPYGDIDTDYSSYNNTLIGANPYWVKIGSGPASCLYFNGTIDELSIWDRILSVNEIMELYQSSAQYGTKTNFSLSENNGGDSDVLYDFFRNGTVAGIYHFDEGSGNETFDYSDNNNSGNFGNSSSWTKPTWRSGNNCKFGSCLSFDGNDFVEAPNSQSLNLTQTVTLTAWINPSSISSYNRIVVKSYDNDTYPWTMYGLMFDSANHLRMEIATGGSQNKVNGYITIPTNNWTFAAGVYNGTHINVYVNGKLDNSTPLSGSIDTNNKPLSIGRSSYDADYFNGTIDEVRVYPRALSYKEILCLYGNNCSEAGFNNDTVTLPIGYYYYISRASEGQNYTSSNFLLPLNISSVIVPFCGDLSCNNGEDCSSCPGDCGSCPPPPPPPPPPPTTYSLNISGLPSLIEINQSLSKTECFTLKNNGTGIVGNISITLSGVTSSWFAITPSFVQQLNASMNTSVCIGFVIPLNAAATDYSFTVNASDRVSTYARSTLRVHEYMNATPNQTVCPASCPEPTNWSVCVNNITTRIIYYCNSTSNYICQSFIESGNCTVVTPPPFDFYKLLLSLYESLSSQNGLLIPLLVVISALIVIFAIYMFRKRSASPKVKEETEVKKIKELKQKMIEEKGIKPVKITPGKLVCPKCSNPLKLTFKGETFQTYKCSKCGYSEVKKTK